MRSSPFEIRQAFADALSSFYPDWQVFPYVKASPSPPSMDVMPGETDYNDDAMARGSGWNTFIVRALVTFGTDVSGQQKLDSLLETDPDSPTAMKNALEADKTLGGVVEDLNVASATEYKTYGGVGTGQIIGVEWTVAVIA